MLAVFVSPLLSSSTVYAAEPKRMIYDEAKLLDLDEIQLLENAAASYAELRETDFIIYTTNNEKNVDVVKLTQDFYDNKKLGYDKPHGNAVILTMDMKNREVYLAGFYKAKTLLDDGRLDKIRNKITSNLSGGYYYSAFSDYISTANRYMGFKPGVNPDNIVFNGWFQLAVAFFVAFFIVWGMRANAGGRVTVNAGTYANAGTSGIINKHDNYLSTTVTKKRIPKPTNTSGGGGGGGRTSGGHSHSGSRGSF
ncbi:TPM domain-containing protein [Paenibacillus sp. NPDC057967]|uniref:TPM domain-containing protein n=1 Tax=Paenibacillus sp. NPDC057967 TaxID=3346293 RepID=UPI0036DDEA99